MHRLLALVLLALPFAASAQNALPLLISYHGRVTDSTGALIGNPTPVNREVIFRVYDHKTNSAPANKLYTEKQTVTIANGEFSVLIGAGTSPAPSETNVTTLAGAFNPTSGTGTIDRYLGVSVADANGAFSEISPRQQIVTTAFALRAKVAEGLSGQVTTAQIADASISGIKLQANSVTQGAIASNNITNSHLQANSVTGDKIADATITVADIADGAITSAKIADGTVTGNDIATGTITRDKIANKTIKWDQIQDGGVGGQEIADGTIGTVDLADGLITTAKLADGAVNAGKLADGAVTAGKLASGVLNFGSGLRLISSDSDNHVDVADQIKIQHADDTNGTLFVGYQRAATPGTGTYPRGFASIQSNYYGVETTPLKLNPAGGKVEVGSGGLQSLSGATVGTLLTVTGPIVSTTSIGTNGTLSVNDTTADNETVRIKGRSGTSYIMNVVSTTGTGVFHVTNAGAAQLYGALTQNVGSDIRLKRDIKPLTGSLEKFLRLRSVTFEYLDQEQYGVGLQRGFVAQEMEPVFPEWVKTRPDGIKTISYSGFESVVVRALQELHAEKEAQLKQRDATIAALEKNVAAMKSEAVETKARLAALEQVLAKFTASGSN